MPSRSKHWPRKALDEAGDVLEDTPVLREPMAIRPISLVASAPPDDQHGWKRVWSKQLRPTALSPEKASRPCVWIKL